MPYGTHEGGIACSFRRFTSQKLSHPWTLLLSASIILFSDGRAVNGKCLLGFARLNPPTLSEVPPTSSAITVRSIVECVAMCTRNTACRQMIYVSVNGTCYILRSPDLMAIAWNTADQWLVSAPNNLMDHVISFAAVKACPRPTACVSDYSLSAGSTSSPDGVQYAGDPQVVQIRHYYSNASNDPSNVGQVQVAYFDKLRSDTALRVQWRALIRTQYYSTASCGRYYVTFNGAECSKPGTIDIIGSDKTVNDEHRTSELDGICYAVPAGNITVAINVGPCPGYNNSDFHTGSRFSINTWIWEIWPSANSSGLPCDSLSIDNIQYQANSDEVSLDPDAAITTMMYKKRASDTLLKVTWLAATRVHVQSDINYCARWYVTVNGSECTPKAEYIIGVFGDTINYTRTNTKTRTLEGYCYGLEAGLYAITVRVGYCQYRTNLPDTNTGGSGSVSRFIVSEVRASTQMQSVQTSVGDTIKIPFFNMRHWIWMALKNYSQSGIIVDVIYNKLSDSSGLHVRFLSVMRAISYCRWYVTINGSECASPGPIEGGTIIKQAAYYHQPGVIDGVCYGYNSGSYKISLKVAYESYTNCYTGFESTAQLIVQETQLNSGVTCSSAKACL